MFRATRAVGSSPTADPGVTSINPPARESVSGGDTSPAPVFTSSTCVEVARELPPPKEWSTREALHVACYQSRPSMLRSSVR